MSEIKMNGQCHCGAVAYEVTARPFSVDYCHCRDCQRSVGAPVGVWMDVMRNQVVWRKGQVTEYASSATIRRGFCSCCGASMSYRSTDHPDYLSLSVATLDDPNAVVPTHHIHTSSQLHWLTIDDGLARYPHGRPSL